MGIVLPYAGPAVFPSCILLQLQFVILHKLAYIDFMLQLNQLSPWRHETVTYLVICDHRSILS